MQVIKVAKTISYMHTIYLTKNNSFDIHLSLKKSVVLLHKVAGNFQLFL